MMLKRFFNIPKPRAHILHVTDPEGTDFFTRVIQRSSIVNYSPYKGLSFKKTSGTPYFIFGGDATDRGSYDLSILEMLLNFKKQYPENVILLAGNREIKQNRFKIELAENLIHRRLFETVKPRWLPSQFSSVPLDTVKMEMREKGKNSENETAIKEYIASLSISEAQIIYLRWMLARNMGSPNSFRYRREELERRLQKSFVTDEEVLQSFLEETKPDGLLGQYLQAAQVGVIIPDTRVMAIHGAMTPENIGRIPGQRETIGNVKTWLDQFNLWYKKQIEEWIAYVPKEITPPGFTALDDAVLPIAGKIKYIITADMLGKQREFVPVPPVVEKYLIENNISIVLSGHQPCGDHPVCLRSQSNNLLFIDGDTGYANKNSENPNDTRGAACHTLEITADHQEAQLVIQATLLNGTEVKTEFTINSAEISGDKFIGRLAENGLVQCRLPDGSYRVINQKNFDVSYSITSSAEISSNLQKSGYTP